MSLAQQKTLGICFSGSQVFYAVHQTGRPGAIERIGQASFQFPVLETVVTDSDARSGVKSVIRRIQQEYSCTQARVVTPPAFETWLSVPKAVYDDPQERDAYFATFGSHIGTANLEPFWFPLSNREFRLLALRDRRNAQLLEDLLSPLPVGDQISDFELGIRWALHSKSKGSYLTLHFFEDRLSVSSFILGKLRGATHVQFSHPGDLPYLWLHHAQHLHWMRGIHDQVLVFGHNASDSAAFLKPYTDQAVEVVTVNSPEKMGIEVADKTYGFDVSQAWPAVLAALEV